jgi:hypothetical protein
MECGQRVASDLLLRLCDQPRSDHRVSLGAKLCMSVERNPVPAVADAGLHCLKAEASDFGYEGTVAKPFGLLSLALSPRSCSGSFHSLGVGLLSLDHLDGSGWLGLEPAQRLTALHWLASFYQTTLFGSSFMCSLSVVCLIALSGVERFI